MEQFFINHIYQSNLWQNNFLAPNETLIFEELSYNNLPAGHFLIKKKKLKGLPFYTMKVTFGPAIDYNSTEFVSLAIERIKQIAIAHKAISVEINPFTWGQKNSEITNLFYANGFKRVAHYIYEATMLIDLELSEDEIFKRFENRGKEAVRQSQRRGITAKKVEASEENFDIFYKLYSDTCKRTQMIPDDYERTKKEVMYFLKNNNGFLFFSFFENKAACAFVAYKCGNCLSLMYQGSDYNEEIQKKRPANALYWETIKWAKANNYMWFDLAGVNANPKAGSKSEGIRLYKRQFGATYVEFPGNFEFINRTFLKKGLELLLPLYSKLALFIARKKLNN